jgi:tRNA A-37 threonylcarbamoyl transferase component Bud32
MKYKVTYFSQPKPFSYDHLIGFVQKDFVPNKIFKDNYRSYVFTVWHNGVTYVVKNPRDKNRRIWIRFLTLFRQSEAIMALKSMETLLGLGIRTTKPIASIEKRLFGIVTEGWMVYEYLEAVPIETPDIKKSYALLCSLHAAGFLHGNPQEQNFLRVGNDMATIDAKLTKTRPNSLDVWIEKIKFANSFIKPSDREIARALIDKTDANYQKALDKMTWIRLIKRPKYWFKGLFQGRQGK